MNRKKLLLEEELKRISQLMGVSYNSKILLEFGGVGRKILLMEAFVPPPKGASGGMEVVLKSLFGDEVAERFARSAADEWSTGLKQLAELVEREGLDDIGKFVDNLKIQKGGAEITQEVLEDAMRKYMRSNPDVLKDILKSSSDYLNKVIGETTAITRIRAVNPALADEIQNIATIRIDATNAATYKQDFRDLATKFKNSGLDMTDASNKKILDGLESKTDMADAFSGTISKPVSDEAVPLVSRTEMRTGKTADELGSNVTPSSNPVNDPTISPTKVDDLSQTQPTSSFTPIYQKVEVGNIFNEKGNLLDGQTLDQNSFVVENPDFIKLGMTYGGMTQERKFKYFNLMMISAIESLKRGGVDAWDKFPIAGFEKFGIDNFREYIKKYGISMKSQRDSDTWSISFRKSSLDPASAVITKEVTTSGINATKIRITPEDFVKGSDATGSFKGSKIVEGMSEREIVALLDETLTERINWIKSDVYKQRRMTLTGESEAEVDAAIKNIEEYMKNDIIYIFNKDQSDAADLEMNWAGLYEPWQSNEYAASQGAAVPKNYLRHIRVKPHTLRSEIKGTLDHEIDHAMSVLLDGSISKQGYENVADKISKILIDVDDDVMLRWEGKNNNGFLKKFVEIFRGKDTPSDKTKKYLKYLEKNVEQQVRLNRIYLWMKKKYDLPIDGKVTDEQVDELYRQWSSGNLKRDPDFIYDMESYLQLFASKYRENIKAGGKDYDEAIGYLKQLLNVTFGIGGIMSVLNIGIGDSEQTN